MKKPIFAVLVALCMAAVPAHASEPYEAMVARLKAGDVKIDYTALRDAYALSPRYQPETADFDQPHSAMLEALNVQDCTKALAAADKVLAATFIDIVTHLVSGRCFEKGGDPSKAEFHRTIARGLMSSIMASGDGTTPKTAYIVVTIAEEYDVLRASHLKLKTQSLVQDNGHSYDAMAVATDTGTPVTLYFQIDRPMQWLSRALQQR